MTYTQWPLSSAWAIGTLVGVSMIISGVTGDAVLGGTQGNGHDLIEAGWLVGCGNI
jgi:hypothetical protein